MKHLKNATKKIIVLLIGLPTTIVGLILIPLPGPGVLITLMGAAILSLEFESARKVRDKAIKEITAIYKRSMDQYHRRLDS